MNIGTALFFCEDKYMLPYSAYIVTALKTDESGNIWFFISRSWNKMVSYDRCSNATMEFYKKGHPFSLSIDGTAELVDNADMVHEFMQEMLGKSLPVKEDVTEGVLLVKVKVATATYKELATAQKPSSSLHTIFAGIRNFRLPLAGSLQPTV